MSSFLDRIKARHAAFISDAVSRGYSEAAARLALSSPIAAGSTGRTSALLPNAKTARRSKRQTVIVARW